jgi:glutamine synthetase
MDPFAEEPTLVVIANAVDPITKEGYGLDPRSVAQRAESYLRFTGIADVVNFGPEAEFFIFDGVEVNNEPHHSGYRIHSDEGIWSSGRGEDDFRGPNLGYRIRNKEGYVPVPPADSLSDLRSEISLTLEECGITVECHHHEVATAGQCEIDFRFSTMLGTADNLQIFKYVVRNTAHQYGKTATFMPKPVYGDNGSGMHVHQSIWKGGKPLFAGNKYADLSQECLWYIGGIIKHAKALNAFTNPSTNSYKRLVPGYEAPVLLAYSARNRSASCRIPWTTSPKAKRVEVRFPDPTANPYLAFAAMLMAGLDGILNKIDPGQAMDKKIPTVCGSLREALVSLDKDRAFLKAGGVFNDDFIDSYIELKMTEVARFEMTPHPIEFQMYYSV